MNRKRILVYGDSNTWGQMAYGNRYPDEGQWTNIVQQQLGDEYTVIQSGIPGRIAGSYDFAEKRHRGKDAFEYAYLTTFPLDMVVVALGTNDLKDDYGLRVDQIFDDLMWYTSAVQKLQTYDVDKFGQASNTSVVYLLPPNFDTDKITDRSEAARKELNDMFKPGRNSYVVVDDLEMSEDGIHFSENDHMAVAQIMTTKIKELGNES